MLRFSCKDSLQFFLAVPCSQSAEPDESFLPCALDGGVLSAFDLIALLLQLLQKLLVVLRLFSQNVVDYAAEPVTIALFWQVKRALLPLTIRLYLNDGELML